MSNFFSSRFFRDVGKRTSITWISVDSNDRLFEKPFIRAPINSFYYVCKLFPSTGLVTRISILFTRSDEFSPRTFLICRGKNFFSSHVARINYKQRHGCFLTCLLGEVYRAPRTFRPNIFEYLQPKNEASFSLFRSRMQFCLLNP